MSSKNKASAVNAAKGRRYTAKEKAEILDYVDKVNAEKGRGGQSAASKKYKISPLTISSWNKSRGSSAMPAVSASAAASGPIGKRLAKLQALHDQIARTEKELAKLRAQFDALKASL
jgi:hypothetical protein